MELFWPPELCPASSDLSVLDNTGRFVSPLTGFVRTVSRPGSRLKLSMQFRNLSAEKRSSLQALFARLRGSDRIWVKDYSYRQRGSFPSQELLPNTAFESTTGWAGSSNGFALIAQDQEMRTVRLSSTSGRTGMLRPSSALTLTPDAPYVFRVLVVPGRGNSSMLSVRSGTGGYNTEFGVLSDLEAGMLTLVSQPYSSTVSVGVAQDDDVHVIAGGYMTIPFISFSRCALVDNGPNMLTNGGDISGGSPWTYQRLTISATSNTGPAGDTLTNNTLKEDSTANDTHYITQQVTVGATANDDYTAQVSVKAAARTFCRIALVSNSTVAGAFVNLSTGEITNLATGASWASTRAHVYDLGNGWWDISVTARKTTTDTDVSWRLYIAEAAGDQTFSGANQDSLRVYRPQLTKSAYPARQRSTTTPNTGTTLQQLSGGINTKGWPVSTDGLLLPGDQVQIGDQLLIVSAPVNSDGLGRAYLETYPAFREAPADGTPVIMCTPLGKFLTDDAEIGWNNVPGFVSNAEIVLGEGT